MSDEAIVKKSSRASSRKFIHATFIQLTAAIFVWFGKMDASGYITISTLALGIYGASSIVDKRFNPDHQP
jgi:hypothetical protein